MGRWSGFALTLLALLYANTSQAAEVSGYVINPNKETRIGNVEVAFYVRQDEQVAELLRKTADADGRFSFSGPFFENGTSFALAAFYKDVTYFSSTLEVGAQKEIIMEVYEPTTDGSDIRIGSHHLFIVRESANIEVVHLAQIHNGREQAYVGSGQGGEKNVTEFRLPPCTFNLESHSGHMHQTEGTRFFDNQPLLPGYSQLSFSFNLDPEQLEDGYVHEVVYPTDRLELFIQPTTIEVSAPFTDLGVMDLHDRQYRRLLLEDLKPGQRVNVPLPLAVPLRWTLKWAALGLGLVAGGGALHGWGRTGGKKKERNLRECRQQLLGTMAGLDRDYTDNRQDASYRATRRRLMDQVVDLTRLLEERIDAG
jgi:hypothetical protein